jgi:hypothetical protein
MIVGSIVKSRRPISRVYQLAAVAGAFSLGSIWWVVLKLLGTRLGRYLGITVTLLFKEPTRRFAKGQAQKVDITVRTAQNL